jgi:hypothetical protein
MNDPQNGIKLFESHQVRAKWDAENENLTDVADTERMPIWTFHMFLYNLMGNNLRRQGWKSAFPIGGWKRNATTIASCSAGTA